MADIYTYLDQISNAVYGREVRAAIHDAIELCYKDATGDSPDSISAALEKVNTAVEKIDAAVSGVDSAIARLDTAIASDNSYDKETVLYDDPDTQPANGSKYQFGTGQRYTDYDYLDLYVNFWGTIETRTYRVEDITTDDYTIFFREVNIPDAGVTDGIMDTPTLWVGEIQMTLHRGSDHDYLQIDRSVYYRNLNGTMSGSEIVQTGTVVDPALTARRLVYIYRIIGRKKTTVPEIIDMRTGYDGTAYASAGAALRALEKRVAALEKG